MQENHVHTPFASSRTENEWTVFFNHEYINIHIDYRAKMRRDYHEREDAKEERKKEKTNGELPLLGCYVLVGDLNKTRL